MSKDKWIRMPLAELTTPAPGRLVMGARYWLVTENGEALFYEGYQYPQCNTCEKLALHWSAAVAKDVGPVHVEHIPMAFVPHACRHYA